VLDLNPKEEEKDKKAVGGEENVEKEKGVYYSNVRTVTDARRGQLY
jgi:hypothetical protein